MARAFGVDPMRAGQLWTYEQMDILYQHLTAEQRHSHMMAEREPGSMNITETLAHLGIG